MRRFIKTFLLFSAMVAGGLFITNPASAASADPQTTGNCSDRFAIMCNGAADAEAMVNYINHADAKLNYKAIYAQYGLKQSDYAKFGTDARTGTIYKDGTIKVGGKTVGRSTMNLGRVQTSTFNKRVNINGQTYWGGSFDDTYHADQAKVIVLMKNGQLKFAAIASCGNPQQLVPPPAPEPEPEPKPEPAYRCDMIQKQRVSQNRYEFTTKATTSGGAKPVKAVYDFGDGDNRSVNNLSTPVTHNFDDDATVRVQVQVRLPGGNTETVSGPDCATRISVREAPEPPKEEPTSNAFCSLFERPVLVDEDRRQYRFTVIARTDNARFTRADFRFNGQGVNATLPAAPNGGNRATINYAFPETGDYTITATLYFVGADGREFSGDCATSLTVAAEPTPPVEECVDADGKNCEQQLVAAGPGTIVAGVFGGTSAMAAAGHFILRRKLGLF